MKNNKILVTGIDSGLGKYLFKKIKRNVVGFNRKTTIDDIKLFDIDTIIHCANNKTLNIKHSDIFKYTNDNLLLTYELSKLPCKKFIYISTVDVYPKDRMLHKEDDVIDINGIDSIYGITKLMSEQIVINNCRNYLILRPTALLGPYMKPNSFTKILTGNYENFNLASQSDFNYVLYKDIFDFIKLACKEDIMGIFNLASKTNVSLLQVAREFKKTGEVPFGDYLYHIGFINNNKVTSIFPAFNKDTLKLIREFKESYK